MASRPRLMVMLPCRGLEECSGGEVRDVNETVGDAFEDAELLLVPSIRPLVTRSAS